MKINDIVENKNKNQEIPASKPRNFVAKNAMSTTSGAGAHRDKKREQKQGYEKHKNKEYMEEGVRLIGRHDAGNRAIAVYRDTEWDEFIVRFYTDGEWHEEADYHTDDKQDAFDTAKSWLKKAFPNQNQFDEESSNVAGTITSVTPDGKQVTMKKPDGTEVTADASAFLPGPNNTVTISQPSPNDTLKPGTVVQTAPQGMGEEINDEEDPDLMGSGHNIDVGGDATDQFIDDVRDKEFEKHNAFGALGRIKQLAGVKETSQPENVVEPEEPADQEPVAEPQRKPRYKWQAGPTSQAYGAPEINIQNPETGKSEYNPAWSDWSKSEKGQEYKAATKAHYDQQLKAMHQHAGVNPKDFDTTIDEVPNPYFKAGGTDDEEDPNYEPEVISVGVDYDYNYHGKHYPATYYEPEEFPELEITINRVVDLDNGEDITKKVDLAAIEKYIEDEIPSWEEAERDARDQAAIDRYEANRDYYDESMERIRKLSGL